MSCPQGNTNQTFLDTAENAGVAWILSIGTALLCFQGTGRYLPRLKRSGSGPGSGQGKTQTGLKPEIWNGGKNPRLGHDQDLEGAKPKLDQTWDPEWRQTLTGFRTESGMEGKPGLDPGWNPKWGKTQIGLGSVSRMGENSD